LVIIFIFCFDATVGPVTYTLVGELPSTRLRVNTIVLARISYNISGMITNFINLRALNPLAWNLQGKSNWIWAGTCLACLVYCWFRLPETKGLTYHELDILFEKKANARKFASIQRRLDETGYFGFYDHRASSSEAAWR
jgi:SP family general alpha glucoside:H+ symporter-like MFS transporter